MAEDKIVSWLVVYLTDTYIGAERVVDRQIVEAGNASEAIDVVRTQHDVRVYQILQVICATKDMYQ